ncbi:pentatricopeptide repeat-containing protein At2g06000-like [Musa acuminata AAA Group]|uniref:pentatricopeptide repeat-containing protein At2g06000-like n=1 Tax=Musa acuminata AAA Group TaxID=214697 RepID=UPI0031D7ACF1
MFPRAPPYHIVVSRHQRHLLFPLLSPRRCPFSGASGSGPDPTDLWIAKLVSTVFHLSPSPAIAADRIAPIRHLLSPSVALAALRRHADPLSALAFFELSCSAFGITHSAAAFRFVIRSLCQSGFHDDALKVFDQMANEGHGIEESFLEFLAVSCIESGKLDLAVGLLGRASEFSCRYQSYTLNKLLSLLVGRNLVNDAVLFLRQHLHSEFLTPDTCSFNIVIKGLCRLGDIDAAFNFSDQMRSFGCSPDMVTHNTLIDGLCRAKQLDRAQELLQRIQLDGSSLPNVVTYTSVISGYCKMGKMEEALGVFSEMTGAGIRPSRVTYNVLIDGYGKVGDMLSAVSVYERMLASGCPPDVVTFTSLIDGYCRSGWLDDAMKLWNEMSQRELKPNAYTYAVAINSFCRMNRLNEARKLLKELKGRRDVMPHAFIYNPVIDGLCKCGRVDEANVVVLEMEERRCKPDKFTYTILIIGHCMKGRMAEAIALFQKMVSSGCTPDSITVNSLVSFLLKAGMPNEINKIMLTASERYIGLDKPCQEIPSSLGKSMGISVAM